MKELQRTGSTSWIVVGALAGLVAVPTLVAVTAVLVHDLRDLVSEEQAIPALVVSATAGLVIGAAMASRALRGSLSMTLFDSVCGAVLGQR